LKRVFTIPKPFRVPDGTLVSPFLNPKDNLSNLPFNLFDGFSIAYGLIKPRTSSKIHILPHVLQVTYVLQGKLKVSMKGPRDSKPYSLTAKKNQAVLTDKSTFLQLINEGIQPCEVLYITSPAFFCMKRVPIRNRFLKTLLL